MSSRTYYDILGVSRDATLEEITSAKNALAKVYHPDANMHKDIDTTAFMQEILEAYRVLSNPAKRKAYNLEIFGVTDRVFKTFKLTPEDEKESVSFVTYWNAAVQLQDIIDQSVRVMERASRTKTFSQKLMKKLGKNPSSKILSFDLIRADNKISEKLKVEENSLVYKIVRLRIADEVPMMVECTYLPEYRFIDLKEKMLKEKPMYDIFREVYNVSLTKAKESFKPILISKSDSKLLNVKDGTAAMRIERVTFENERVIEYTVSVSRGDKFEYTVVLEED